MAALLLVLLFSGCAGKKADSWQEDRELVMKSLEDAHLKAAKLEKSVDQLDQRVLELQKTVVHQQARIEALTAGQEAKHRPQLRRTPTTRPTQHTKTTTAQSAAELNRQLDRIANNIDSTIAGEQAPATSPANDEQDTYTAAYLAFKSGKYDESIATFRTLLAKYPNGQYSDQAYYWLGEGLLAQHKTKEAAKAFNAVAMHYPKSSKHAMALLKLAISYRQMKRNGDARAALQRLIREHPGTPAAKEGRTLLKPSTEKSK